MAMWISVLPTSNYMPRLASHSDTSRQLRRKLWEMKRQYLALTANPGVGNPFNASLSALPGCKSVPTVIGLVEKQYAASTKPLEQRQHGKQQDFHFSKLLGRVLDSPFGEH